MAQVGIVMGSDSDMPIMSKAADILEELGMTRIQLSNLSSETDQEEADGKDYLSIMYENLSVLSTLSSVSISPEIQ